LWRKVILLLIPAAISVGLGVTVGQATGAQPGGGVFYGFCIYSSQDGEECYALEGPLFDPPPDCATDCPPTIPYERPDGTTGTATFTGNCSPDCVVGI
jgi:hypothetical protein